MPTQVLILDDDDDFNTLLTDVFSHAGYEVTSLQSPLQALDIFHSRTFDLIVTDQRMPGLTGAEFVRRVRKIRPLLPIIMVSGFLDNETVRDLIKLGVDGVFSKPVNIFHLLKKAGQLLERQQATILAKSGLGGPEGGLPLSFSFVSFPCRSPKSAAFAKALYQHRQFKKSLLLIGEEGSDFEGICLDLCSFEQTSGDQPVPIPAEDIHAEHLLSLFHNLLDRQARQATIIILNADALDSTRADIILQMAHQQGAFFNLRLNLRFVFCFHQEVDVLYEAGRLNDQLYLFIGTDELQIPSLRDIPTDLPILARRVLNQIGAEYAEIDSDGMIFIEQQDWPGNYDQFAKVLQTAHALSNGLVITEEHLRLSYQGGTNLAPDEKSDEAPTLHEILRRRRDEYIEAALELFERDPVLAAEALHIPVSMTAAILSALTPQPVQA